MLNIVIDHLAIHRLEVPTPPPVREDLLYVVLHGLVSMVEIQDKIHLYLLNMGKDHRYLAGTWLAETDVAHGTFSELLGVSKDGHAGVDPVANPVLKLTALPPRNQDDVLGVIVVPRPRKLYSLDRGTITITTGQEHLVSEPETLSGVRVLEYVVKGGFAGVEIKGTGFQYTLDHFSRFANEAGVAAIHIYDMPGGEVGPNHHVDEFAVSSKVLGAPIEIGEAVQIVEESTLPPGLSNLELKPLDSRSSDISAPLLDFIRMAEWNPKGSVTGACRACCGGSDGQVSP